MSSADFLDAAEAIGRRVVADAIWHDGRCSWVGVSMDPKEAWQAEYHALEPNLYDGTAGIGLFLAELGAVTGDAAVRRTALGALRQAVVRAPAHRREGFHAGSLGIAWAAARAAEVLEDEELKASARALPASAAPVPDGHLGRRARQRRLDDRPPRAVSRCSTMPRSSTTRSPPARRCSPAPRSRATAGPGRPRTSLAAATCAACRTAPEASAGRLLELFATTRRRPLPGRRRGGLRLRALVGGCR